MHHSIQGLYPFRLLVCSFGLGKSQTYRYCWKQFDKQIRKGSHDQHAAHHFTNVQGSHWPDLIRRRTTIFLSIYSYIELSINKTICIASDFFCKGKRLQHMQALEWCITGTLNCLPIALSCRHVYVCSSCSKFNKIL